MSSRAAGLDGRWCDRASRAVVPLPTIDAHLVTKGNATRKAPAAPAMIDVNSATKDSHESDIDLGNPPRAASREFMRSQAWAMFQEFRGLRGHWWPRRSARERFPGGADGRTLRRVQVLLDPGDVPVLHLQVHGCVQGDLGAARERPAQHVLLDHPVGGGRCPVCPTPSLSAHQNNRRQRGRAPGRAGDIPRISVVLAGGLPLVRSRDPWKERGGAGGGVGASRRGRIPRRRSGRRPRCGRRPGPGGSGRP